jgi:hypothetical protein
VSYTSEFASLLQSSRPARSQDVSQQRPKLNDEMVQKMKQRLSENFVEGSARLGSESVVDEPFSEEWPRSADRFFVLCRVKRMECGQDDRIRTFFCTCV